MISEKILPFLTLIMVLFFLSNEILRAESWEKTFGGPSWDKPSCVQQTSDGGFIIVGSTRSYGTGGYDVWLIKTDSVGNHAWNRTYGGIKDDTGHWVQQTSDGGYIVVGETESFGAGRSDVYLIKIDKIGNEVWSKTFGGTQWEDSATVQETNDGGYIIGGDTSSFFPEGYWLIKTDKDGEKVWDKIIDDPRTGGQGEATKEVWQTTDGGYILIGQTDAYGTDYEDLIKIDDEGNVVWWKRWPSNTSGLYFTSGKQTSDSGYILVGSQYTNTQNGGSYKIWLSKTDQNGDTLWSETFDGEKGDQVLQTKDNGYVIKSIQSNTPPISGLIKTDKDGNLSWIKTFNQERSGYQSSFSLTDDGGFIIVDHHFAGTSITADVKLIYYKHHIFVHSLMHPSIIYLLLPH